MCLESAIIVLDGVSKLRLELIKCRNDNAMEKFYPLRMFRKVEIFAWYGRFFGHSPLYLHIGGAKPLDVRSCPRKLAHNNPSAPCIRVTR